MIKTSRSRFFNTVVTDTQSKEVRIFSIFHQTGERQREVGAEKGEKEARGRGREIKLLVWRK